MISRTYDIRESQFYKDKYDAKGENPGSDRNLQIFSYLSFILVVTK